MRKHKSDLQKLIETKFTLTLRIRISLIVEQSIKEESRSTLMGHPTISHYTFSFLSKYKKIDKRHCDILYKNLGLLATT